MPKIAKIEAPTGTSNRPLTTGVDAVADFTGTAADDTFIAPATVGTAAATTVNSGDTLDGGAGKDTLTITATADNNRSLTGLAVSNIETINLVGANNFGTSTTTTTAPAVAAGAKQVQVLDIANLSPVGERQTIDFVGRTKSGAGTYTFEVAGVSLTTASIAADATAATIATAVNTAITTAAGLAVGAAGSLNGIVASNSATSGVVTVNFTAAAGDVAAAVAGATGLSGAATVDTPAVSTFTAETQTLGFGTVTKATAGTYAFTVAGVSLTTASIADAANASTIATAVNTAITTAAALAVGATGSLNGIVASSSVSTNTVTVKFTVGAGDVASSIIGATGLSAAGMVTTSTAFAARDADLAVTVNGAQYSVASTIDPGVLSSNTTVRDAAQIVSKNNARTAINALLTDVIGNAISVGTSDEAGEIKLTSNTVGTAAPTITAAGRDSASNLISVDAADAATVANAGRTGAAAVAQQVQYTVGGVVAAEDTFTLYINGTNLGNVATGGTAAAGAATNIAAAINAALGTGVASSVGGVITVTAPVAGTSLPLISIKANDAAGSNLTLVRSDVRDNVSVGSTTTTTTLGAASVAASQFVGAEAINLSGASNSTSVSAVAAGQTVGFTGLSGIVSTVGFASTVTNGLLSTTGSSGAVTVTGSGLTSLSLAGTTAGGTTTTLALTEGATSATVDTIKALNVSTSGSTVLDTTGLSALTSVTQTGAGGVTLNAASTATQAGLATITTGAGADNIRVTTAVAADIASTTINETVTAVVSTGAGNDRVIVATGATNTNGITTVDLGDGNDTLILDTINTGANTLSGGAGDDVFRIGNISTLASTSISGGTGTDVLRTSDDTITTADYTTLTANVSSVETLQLTGNAVSLDASRVAMGRIEFLGTGTNTVTEVSSAQTLAAVRTAASAESFGFAAVAAPIIVSNITATSKGYVLDNDAGLTGNQTVFGDNLNIAMTHVASTGSVVAKGAALTLSVTALGDTSNAAASSAATAAGTNVEGISSKVTLTGDVQSATVTLASARGVGTTATPAALGEEEMAQFAIALDSNGEAALGDLTLGNLGTVKVSGAGVVTIDASTNANNLVANLGVTKLKTIDLSGMTAFADLNDKGQEWDGTTVGNYSNKSTSTVTLDNQVAETVLLGGAKDTVATGSTIAAVDTITGFQVVASAANPLVADAARSDVLNIGADSSTAWTVLNAAKMTVTGTTLEAALLQAASHTFAGTTNAADNVLFHFGGDTYAYQDVGGNGLDDSDVLVKMSGTLNLDLLLTSSTIV